MTMCPISGMVQFLIVVVALLLAFHTVIVKTFKVSFTPSTVTLKMYDYMKIDYEIKDLIGLPGDTELMFYSENKNIASLEKEILLSNPQANFAGSFNITGNFLGRTIISCKNNNTKQVAEGNLDVIVVRKHRLIDTIFTASVAILVSILYINFGAAMDWSELRGIIKKPVGPTIGLCGHFLIMPLLSFGLGKLLFPNSPEMQLGMFFTGVTPAGGASNVWTVLLEGNLSLSVIMTATSTLAAFGLMPLWIFTLGRVIFKDAKLAVPYTQISSYVVSLIVPLAIGYLVQRYCKRLSEFMTRIMKGFASLLILFIVIFAIITNLYLFKLFSWQIMIYGMSIPWLGYLCGYVLAKLCRQAPANCITIAIEVGIQNTGIAIFLLRFALPQPHADLTTVAPVAVAVLTPFPLMFIYLVKKLQARLLASHSKLICHEEDLSKVNNNGNKQSNGKGDGFEAHLLSVT
ncbi:hypothetical protein NQ318_017998 [Aromia moschata]|uniref:Solute carrier family 10 member 6 n=1 Tax=Aromia moschata TaxID=1265417 RepID=A0AAV8Y9R8_9CUCU|nr:hypothetical protein NQ318_017998 [Aromia moschata]